MNKSTIPADQRLAIGMLLDDHRSAKKHFKAFEQASSDDEKGQIAREVCMELTAHTQLEEELFYPFLRDVPGLEDMLDEAVVEHASAKDLIAQIQAMQPGDDLFDAKVTVLGEYINHHVGEEEGELFPKVIAKKVDMRELGERMKARKEELMAVATA
ncbi:hemerythrin domain-containing protein [Pigmentiphaga soli]|uniref:Hemerythrin domain-containing protein n=1 Tax=Pigmentiphaga soli TaxID=1007095 RepID=A0ABP8HMK9_9BURK